MISLFLLWIVVLIVTNMYLFVVSGSVLFVYLLEWCEIISSVRVLLQQRPVSTNVELIILATRGYYTTEQPQIKFQFKQYVYYCTVILD